jgi:hypothetical protein
MNERTRSGSGEVTAEQPDRDEQPSADHSFGVPRTQNIMAFWQIFLATYYR